MIFSDWGQLYNVKGRKLFSFLLLLLLLSLIVQLCNAHSTHLIRNRDGHKLFPRQSVESDVFLRLELLATPRHPPHALPGGLGSVHPGEGIIVLPRYVLERKRPCVLEVENVGQQEGQVRREIVWRAKNIEWWRRKKGNSHFGKQDDLLS